MKEFEGRITISKTTANSGPEFISIEIVDNDTRKRLKVKLSLDAFAGALTGQGFTPCECETNLHEMPNLQA